MPKLSLTLFTNNAAFDENPGEAARILRRLADLIEQHGVQPGAGGMLRDINGNTVGDWNINK